MKFADQFHDVCSMDVLARLESHPGHLLLKDAIHAPVHRIQRVLLLHSQ